MADELPTLRGDIASASQSPMKHTFGLLASAELGAWPTWTGPDEDGLLRSRVELAAVLLNIIPRSELNRLDVISEHWSRLFPENIQVSVSELRESARAFLRPLDARSRYPALDEESVQKAGELSGGTAIRKQSAAAPITSDDEGQHQFILGFATWFDELKNGRRWRHLPSVVPGEAPTEIDQIYVELFVSRDQDVFQSQNTNAESFKRISRRTLASECPVVNIPTMVARTLRRCIVMGEPGSGKSTIVQWLARATRLGKIADFDAALVIKLSAFASALAKRPGMSLLEFFFVSLGTSIANWEPGVRWLRRVAATSNRYLLLLDGWDEIPVPHREVVRERILDEQSGFVTIITSRPSGLPYQFRDENDVEFYHVAGLTNSANEDLVRNLLRSMGRMDQLDTILGRIRTEPDLCEMAANPFLLGLLVRVLTRAADAAKSPLTLASVFDDITGWIKEVHNQSSDEKLALGIPHLAGMCRLSYRLLFEAGPTKYLFRAQELDESMTGVSSEAVCRSRFINRVDPRFDEHTFLHATFQEYFAARHIGTLAPEMRDEIADRAFQSVSRLIVLQFVAGQTGDVSAWCEKRAEHWLQRQDRFLQVLLRVARLAAAGRWSDGGRGACLGRALRDDLWLEIRRMKNMALTRAAVEAFADLDPLELSRRARRAQNLDNWAVQCIVDAVPSAIRVQEQLDKLLKGEWKDYAGFDVRGGATPAELEAIQVTLTDPKAKKGGLRTAIIHAGAARARGAVPALTKLLAPGYKHNDLQDHAIDSLGAIGGREAVDSLVAVVMGDAGLSESSVEMAVNVLCRRDAGLPALDPVGRDRLVRRLAVLPFDDPQLKDILAALEGHPLRDGSEVIAHLARRTEGNVAIRTAATRALATVMDRRILHDLVGRIEFETMPEVARWFLNLAVAHSIPIPLSWLEEKIAAARIKVKMRELFTAYLIVLPVSAGGERDRASKYMHRHFATAFTDDTSPSLELAEVLDQALSRANPEVADYLADETLELALDIIAKFRDAPAKASPLHISLAANILGRFRRLSTASDLRSALDVALRLNQELERNTDRASQSLANALGAVSPGELLNFSVDCECVQATLCSMAIQRGWLIFDHRIVDAEGVEIARSNAASVPRNMPAQPLELKDLIDQLPIQMRQALHGYWLMVKDNGPCQPTDSLKKIYSEMIARARGEIGDDVTSDLDQIFHEAFPEFEAWRKTLKRIEKRVSEQPEILTLLRRIGLCRRPKKA